MLYVSPCGGYAIQTNDNVVLPALNAQNVGNGFFYHGFDSMSEWVELLASEDVTAAFDLYSMFGGVPARIKDAARGIIIADENGDGDCFDNSYYIPNLDYASASEVLHEYMYNKYHYNMHEDCVSFATRPHYDDFYVVKDYGYLVLPVSLEYVAEQSKALYYDYTGEAWAD